MAKAIWIAVFLLAVALPAGAQRARIQQVPPADLGRYRVVNPNPEFARSLYLLDTWTGASWIACSDGGQADSNLNWCRLNEPLSPSSRVTGRWDIVNGHPGTARNIMLIDTFLGDTFVACTRGVGASSWCTMTGGPVSNWNG